MLLLVSQVVTATEWEISPSNPEVGDTLEISGTADPNATLTVKISFEKTATVSNGQYEYDIDKVKIPGDELFPDNRFTVRAEKVQAVDVNVKKFGITFAHLGADASGGVATVSKGFVPPGTYGISIIGNAQSGESTVSIKITAEQAIQADSDGNFEYRYDASFLPAGDFQVAVGGTTKTITLEEEGSGSDPGSSSSSGLSGSSGSRVKTTPSTNESTSEVESPTKSLNYTEVPENMGEGSISENSTQSPVSNTSEESNVNTGGTYLLTLLIMGLLINTIYLKRKLK